MIFLCLFPLSHPNSTIVLRSVFLLPTCSVPGILRPKVPDADVGGTLSWGIMWVPNIPTGRLPASCMRRVGDAPIGIPLPTRMIPRQETPVDEWAGGGGGIACVHGGRLPPSPPLLPRQQGRYTRQPRQALPRTRCVRGWARELHMLRTNGRSESRSVPVAHTVTHTVRVCVFLRYFFNRQVPNSRCFFF